jgi:hypothetical protein
MYWSVFLGSLTYQPQLPGWPLKGPVMREVIQPP